MDLTSTANLVKKIAAPILALIIIIILITLIIMRLNRDESTIQPAETELQPISIEEISSLNLNDNRITFDTSNIKTPTTVFDNLTVFHIDQSQSLLDKPVFASKLNFVNEPQDITDSKLGPGLAYTNQQATLLVYEQAIIYENKNIETSINNPEINVIKQKAQDFLTNLNLDSTGINESVIKYGVISGEQFTQIQDPDLSQFTILNFPQLISKIPLIIGSFTQSNMVFDRAGNIYKLQYFQPPLISPLGEYPLISTQEAILALNAGKGILVKTESNYKDVRIYSQINNAAIKEANLSYYLNSNESSTLQPYWVFEGTSTLEDNSVFNVVFVLSAVDPQFLISPFIQP